MADVNDNTKNFIDQLSLGKNDDAGEAFKAALRDKVANSLDNARKDIAYTDSLKLAVAAGMHVCVSAGNGFNYANPEDVLKNMQIARRTG